MNKKKLIIVLSIILVAALALLFNLRSKPTLDYELIEIKDNKASLKVNIKSVSIINNEFKIAVDNNPTQNENTKFSTYNSDDIYELDGGTYYIHVLDNLGNTIDSGSILNTNIAITINNDLYPFYPINDEINLDYEVISIGEKQEVNITSSDENVVKVEGNVLKTLSKGTSTITLSSSDISKTIDIEVTDLYILEDPEDNKPVLKETICTIDEAHKLDEVLKMKIDEAGFGTRAGVVEAARFLALQFPYKLAYFSESGRLDSTIGTTYCDGEGRYYHYGLYLSEDKFDLIEASIYGPKYWGQFFKEDTSDDHSKDDYYLVDGFVPADIGTDLYLSKRPNGFDCSGYVAWAYYNGGYDFGDMGAGGPDTYGMSMLGERVNITNELLQSDRIKAGDLIGFSAHIGIIIGVEDNAIWVADTLISGLKVRKYERNEESFFSYGENSFRYIMLMDDEYKTDGNYTAMWY